MKKLLQRLFVLGIICLLQNDPVYAGPDIKNTTGGKKNVVKKKSLPLKKGSLYIVGTGSSKALFYSRSIKKTGSNLYTTTYNIFDENKKLKSSVVAVHNKKNKRVDVSVRDFEYKGSPVTNREYVTYESPYMGHFGIIGKVGALGKGISRNKAPGQLTVKFASKRFDYVNVVHLADAHEDDGQDLRVYVLEENTQ